MASVSHFIPLSLLPPTTHMHTYNCLPLWPPGNSFPGLAFSSPESSRVLDHCFTHFSNDATPKIEEGFRRAHLEPHHQTLPNSYLSTSVRSMATGKHLSLDFLRFSHVLHYLALDPELTVLWPNLMRSTGKDQSGLWRGCQSSGMLMQEPKKLTCSVTTKGILEIKVLEN